MTTYLTLDETLFIHDRVIREFGGASGIRDLGLVDSALMRPQTGWYADLIEEAAALWESLAMNHGFVDGNKPVAVAVVDVFLGMNGFDIPVDDATIEAFIYHHLEAHTFHKDVLEAWLRQNAVSI